MNPSPNKEQAKRVCEFCGKQIGVHDKYRKSFHPITGEVIAYIHRNCKTPTIYGNPHSNNQTP